MKKLYIPLFLFAGMSLGSYAQDISRNEARGDKHVFNYSYDEAIESYTSADDLSTNGQRKLALSFMKMGRTAEAEITSAKLVTAANAVPEDFFNYAMILKMNGKYTESTVQMDKFYDLQPEDLRAQDYKAHRAELESLRKDEGRQTIKLLDVNSDAQDFGTCYYKEKVVFASSRSHAKMVKRTYNANGKPFLNLFVSEVKDGQLQKPDKFDKSFNTKMHDGPANFSADGTFMAFTRNKPKDKSKDDIVELQIYFSTFKEGKWSEPEAFVYNNPGYSVGHPALSANGNVMYYTSDQPGGYGKADLYRVIKTTGGTWGAAENLGDDINTEGDELFPFMDDNSGIFFFSSNGRYGLGGLDVFMGTMTRYVVSDVHNAGAPVNSQYDDFAAIAEATSKKGFFSSNRRGIKHDDDIYAVEFLKGFVARAKIEGFAMDLQKNILKGTFITLLDDKGKFLDTVTTDMNGAFSFSVPANRDFTITGTKETYVMGDTIANTFGKEPVVHADVILLKKEEAIAKQIVPAADLSKIAELGSVLFDLDKWNIREDAAKELDKIIVIMNKYPKMHVTLTSHTDCRESKDYNQLLSERRAKASLNYIRKGISKPARISGKGVGKSKLINNCQCDGEVVSGCSEEEHQKNRRTEFLVQ